MTAIRLTTKINADKPIVFDVSRNIDFHQQSLSHTSEKAIAGRTSGLIELDETVTWRGKHFGFQLTHQSKIIEMHQYDSFADEMLKGCFTSFVHYHYFEEEEGATIMIDEVYYETPYGMLGRLFDYVILRKYLRKLIEKRNDAIKKQSEKTKQLG
ncbi:MAG TPA: SRPBCC family protein [Flavobacterium sp.]|nr:SRPBCC family protein [Flavobacterium sp.]